MMVPCWTACSYKGYLTLANWRYAGTQVMIKKDVQEPKITYSLVSMISPSFASILVLVSIATVGCVPLSAFGYLGNVYRKYLLAYT